MLPCRYFDHTKLRQEPVRESEFADYSFDNDVEVRVVEVHESGFIKVSLPSRLPSPPTRRLTRRARRSLSLSLATLHVTGHSVSLVPCLHMIQPLTRSGCRPPHSPLHVTGHSSHSPHTLHVCTHHSETAARTAHCA